MSMSKSSLHRVDKVRVFEKAVDQLRAAILEGEFEPGEKLPTEQELTEILGLGRSTIREAFRVLETEGLIEVFRGSGAFVTERSDWVTTRGEVLRWLTKREESVLQILQVRECIEGLTASLAAKEMTREGIEQLKSITAQFAKLVGSEEINIDKLGNLDVRFHLLISSASGNDIANEIVSHVVPAFSEANRAVLWVGRGADTTAREHEAILNAIDSGNMEDAEKCMREHISRVRDDINKYLNEASAESTDNTDNSELIK